MKLEFVPMRREYEFCCHTKGALVKPYGIERRTISYWGGLRPRKLRNSKKSERFKSKIVNDLIVRFTRGVNDET